MTDVCAMFFTPSKTTKFQDIFSTIKEEGGDVEDETSATSSKKGVRSRKQKSKAQRQRPDPTKEPSEESIDPFVAYEHDGYKFPDLYTELLEMVQSNLLINPLADLRALAREEQRKVAEGISKAEAWTPDTNNTTMESSGETESESSSNHSKHNTREDKTSVPPLSKCLDLPMARRDVVRLIGQNLSNMSENRAKNYNLLKKNIITYGDSLVSPTTVVAVDDKFAEHELVYSIEINDTRKAVIVCFRGSITKADWATDFEIYMKEVENPVKSHAGQQPTVLIHNGFHDYLFEPSPRGVKGPEGQDLSEYQEILQEHVVPILKAHPGYKLYVTGHSLGAALATLFGYEAAAEPDAVIPKPVSLFSIGGSYVGDESFRASHQLLESLGKLRHLRVSNQSDLVTTMPKFSFKWTLSPSAHVGTPFKHVGVNIRLLDDKKSPMEISYPKVLSPRSVTRAIDELGRGWNQSIFTNWSWNPMDLFNWPWHSLIEYNRRIQRNQSILGSLELNELYARQDLVGDLVPQF